MWAGDVHEIRLASGKKFLIHFTSNPRGCVWTGDVHEIRLANGGKSLIPPFSISCLNKDFLFRSR